MDEPSRATRRVDAVVIVGAFAAAAGFGRCTTRQGDVAVQSAVGRPLTPSLQTGIRPSSSVQEVWGKPVVVAFVHHDGLPKHMASGDTGHARDREVHIVTVGTARGTTNDLPLHPTAVRHPLLPGRPHDWAHCATGAPTPPMERRP